ncbi:hypothetical protein SAMN02799622_05428 [Methylobacterium sp. UNC378MF]|uniref:hypothetical protein n=1 Tax=Methylobacterium sp. UNC378MF TaxID=1502748 RepID=UPI000888E7BC|nr:hypothetical protein [Methylobacterium sp. UNC378MF]SDA33032.1 hypothetical protein SAMN02799622_05428 [Methylobacterium sp. UNC378MF]
MAGKPATAEHVRRYAQLHPFGSTQEDPECSKIDGIWVVSFASLSNVEDFLVTADHAAIEAAEAEFADTGASEFWTAVNYGVVNRLVPELATER